MPVLERSLLQRALRKLDSNDSENSIVKKKADTENKREIIRYTTGFQRFTQLKKVKLINFVD